MSAPARSRPALGGVYLLVLALLISLAVLSYRKALPWQGAVEVRLTTATPGLELNPQSDVKLQGRVVGEVRSITSSGRDAEITLRLRPEEAERIPANVDAVIIPKTLFGEKYVDLRIPDGGGTGRLSDGSVIAQSRTSVEIGTVFTRLEPVLRGLRPDQLSVVLRSLATGLDGQGAALGATFRDTEKALTALNPDLGTLVDDFRKTGEVADIYADATPDLVKILAASTDLSTNLAVPQEAKFTALLNQTINTSKTTAEVLDENATAIVRLTSNSQPVLKILKDYSPALGCFITGFRTVDNLTNRVFGGQGPFLDLTIDRFAAHTPYKFPEDLPGRTDNDASNDRLPATVPSWDPHCPEFRPDVMALGPLETSVAPRSEGEGIAGTAAPDVAVAEARASMARLTAAQLLGKKTDTMPAYAELFVLPLMNGEVTIP